MRQIRFRQVDRLKKIALPYIERRQQYKIERHESLRQMAFQHIANLSLLLLFGNPRIDEPLLNAWDRVRKSAAWQACRKEHPNFGEYGTEDQGDFGEYRCDTLGTKLFDNLHGRYIATPFDFLGATYIANYFRKFFIPDLPGTDETEKLNAIIDTALPWFLWFTHGDLDAYILGLKIPDLSRVNQFARSEPLLYCLPLGPFEYHPWPDGACDKFTVTRHQESEDKANKMTPRERKRALRFS
jgi:hypothetical protein